MIFVNIEDVSDRGQYGPISQFVFSGGEVQIGLPYPLDTTAPDSARITAHLRSSDDIMSLLLVTDALRRNNPSIRLNLTCPYFPYARQDRVCAPGEALSVRVMADLINSQNYETVEVWDPHSDVAPALLNRAIVRSSQDIIRKRYVDYLDNTILVAPDAGALKKVGNIAKEFSLPMVRADKTRDPKTGSINGTIVYSDHVGNNDFLVVDDICDGGRTFIELAKKLRPLTDGKLLLYITHGIFSQGFKDLGGVYNEILCPNPFTNYLPDFITVRPF